MHMLMMFYGYHGKYRLSKTHLNLHYLLLISLLEHRVSVDQGKTANILNRYR